MEFSQLLTLRKPGTYIDINTRDPRRAISATADKVLLVIGGDAPTVATSVTSVKQVADLADIGSTGVAMMTAAIATNQFMDVQVIGLGE